MSGTFYWRGQRRLVRPGKWVVKGERRIHLLVKAHVADWLVTAAREQDCDVTDIVDNLLTDAAVQARQGRSVRL